MENCRLATLILWCSSVAVLTVAGAGTICNPPKRVNITGNIIIGGLIPVHAGKENNLNEPGIMWVEAMMFAIREINENPTLLPNLKLGYDIRDSCNKIDLALTAALDFILSPNENQASSYAVRRDNANQSYCLCNSNNSSFPPVMAVVGGATSRISATVSPLFSADNIPQISYSSTSPSLSEKSRFRSFLRTIPSDVYQAEAIADILAYFNWTYVSVVVSDDEYGRNGLVALRNRLKIKRICIAVEETFSTTSTAETQRDSANIVRQLKEAKRSKVVVLWCERPKAIAFLQMATAGELFNMTWIGTESWGDNNIVKETIDFDIIGGMLGVLPFLGRNAKFEKHLKTLTPMTVNLNGNPWLKEYWSQSKFTDKKCIKTSGNCSSYELPNASLLPPNKYANVMDAVYAIAHGIHNMIKSNPKKLSFQKQMLGDFIKNATFRALSGKGTFKFTNTGDPEFGAYLIKNLQKNKLTGLKEFTTIAQWDGETYKLEFNKQVEMQWNAGQISTPVSRCSELCLAGFYFVKTSVECCWNCLTCEDGFYKDTVGNSDCKPCPNGYISSDDRTHCVKLELDFLKWDSALSVAVLLFCSLGLLLITFVIVVFRKYSKTAVVKASNRELSMVHLVSHGLIFLLPLLFMGQPTNVICVLRPYFFSVLFTVITSITSLKTDRIVRIFNSKSRLTKRSRLLSNKVQFMLIFIMACIPAAVTTIWIILKPLTATTTRTNSADLNFVVFCGDHAATLHLVHLAYVLLLALLCTYEAYHARRLPENFNEAKFICFSMFGFVLMWVGYIPGYSDTIGSTKQFITCLFTLLTNYTTLLVIYGPKLNIILLHPQVNRPENFRNATLTACVQHVRRLSLAHSPDTLRVVDRVDVNDPLHFVNKVRSSSELTDSSVGSRDTLVAGSAPGSFEMRNISPSPLTFGEPSSRRSWEPERGFEASKRKLNAPSLFVKGRPLFRPKDSDGVPKIRVPIEV